MTTVSFFDDATSSGQAKANMLISLVNSNDPSVTSGKYAVQSVTPVVAGGATSAPSNTPIIISSIVGGSLLIVAIIVCVLVIIYVKKHQRTVNWIGGGASEKLISNNERFDVWNDNSFRNASQPKYTPLDF